MEHRSSQEIILFHAAIPQHLCWAKWENWGVTEESTERRWPLKLVLVIASVVKKLTVYLCTEQYINYKDAKATRAV